MHMCNSILSMHIVQLYIYVCMHAFVYSRLNIDEQELFLPTLANLS